jgi:hypothetical protein
MFRRSDYDYDHIPWFLTPVRPELTASLRQSTAVSIWILFFLMVGLLSVALTPQPGHAKAVSHQVQPQHKVPATMERTPHSGTWTVDRHGSVLIPLIESDAHPRVWNWAVWDSGTAKWDSCDAGSPRFMTGIASHAQETE